MGVPLETLRCPGTDDIKSVLSVVLSGNLVLRAVWRFGEVFPVFLANRGNFLKNLSRLTFRTITDICTRCGGLFTHF